MDTIGRPEVYAIGPNNALYVNDGGMSQGLGGYVRKIAAPSFGTGLPADVAYAIGSNHAGYLCRYGFVSLGGSLYLQG